jgi:hypothetical protein
MWRKLDGFDGTVPDEPCSAEPLVCLVYEDEADRQEMLSRIQKAGLGGLPRVMISVEHQSAEPVPALAGARGRRPVKVA